VGRRKRGGEREEGRGGGFEKRMGGGEDGEDSVNIIIEQGRS